MAEVAARVSAKVAAAVAPAVGAAGASAFAFTLAIGRNGVYKRGQGECRHRNRKCRNAKS
jgi:hypothetical protein